MLDGGQGCLMAQVFRRRQTTDMPVWEAYGTCRRVHMQRSIVYTATAEISLDETTVYGWHLFALGDKC